MKVFFLLLCLPVLVFAQEMGLDRLAQRQAAFGRTIPQEKVFIHMDNTSYQLGDTIWFTAYTRRTDTGRPSDVSGVLYVELFGQEGYMTERKLIQMKEGRGQGFFALNRQIQYAGFYELRAYTRWQLNWGRFEHEHTRKFGEQFPSRQKEQEFCRDYEKLYSRVFPVYDRPVEPGDFSHDMTLRAMRRVYKKDPVKRELHLSLYPEGGALVEGLPCRIAFEAAWDDGEWADGWLHFGGDSARTLNRGRGLFEVVGQTGQEQEVLFINKDGKTAKARLPKAEQSGVSLRVEQTDSGWVARVRHSADLSADSLGVSLMQEGRAVKSEELRVKNEELRVKNKGNNSGGGSNSDSSLFVLHSSLSSSGIYQLTVFDTRGRVFADRLFFHRGKETLEPTLSIEGLKDEYQPYEAVSLKVKAPSPDPSPEEESAKPQVSPRGDLEGAGLSFSLSVRDDLNRDFLYDDGNILTEMLLSSEIRGFVPHPGWYFEEDDSLHRAALDLLMMTQGWRRFDWQSMALPGAWDITEPAEKSPILTGSTQRNVSLDGIEFGDSNQGRASRDKNGYLRALNQREQEKNSRELKVHAELVVLDADTTFTGESVTEQGTFRIQPPPFYGQSILFLSVADTTKWKKKKPYTWIQAEPDDAEDDRMFLPSSRKLRRKIFVEPAEYLARICWPYPRFVKPYTYHQEHLAPTPLRLPRGGEEGSLPSGRFKGGSHSLSGEMDGGSLQEVTVKARRNGLRRFDDTWPVLSIDAYEASNMSKDYGLGFMQVMVADYGVGAPSDDGGIKPEPTFETRYGFGRTRRMLTGRNIPKDSIYARKYLASGSFVLTSAKNGPTGIGGFNLSGGGGLELSPGESMEYRGTGVWDMYVFYSDYSPRMYGSDMYYGANEPKTKVVMYPFPDGSRRLTYRDRRYVLEGFAYPAEFYSPDYSSRELPQEGTDYRRTLYWNPDVRLDENGEASISFYNNCRTTVLSVEAEGQATDGTLLWTK